MTTEREREAREEVVMCYHPANFSEAEFAERLDAYAAAVAERASREGYARAIGDAIRCVEGYHSTHGAHNCTLCASDLVCHDAAADWVHNAVLDAITTRLRAMEET